MRKSLLALIFSGSAPFALAIAPSPTFAGAALAAPKAVDAASVVTRVDYNGRYYHRHYRRGPASYGYYAPRAYYGARSYYGAPANYGAPAYYRAPAYYAPPVVYYPPPVVVYYPPPVVYGAYPPVAPYRYGTPAAAYYGGGDSDW